MYGCTKITVQYQQKWRSNAGIKRLNTSSRLEEITAMHANIQLIIPHLNHMLKQKNFIIVSSVRMIINVKGSTVKQLVLVLLLLVLMPYIVLKATPGNKVR